MEGWTVARNLSKKLGHRRVRSLRAGRPAVGRGRPVYKAVKVHPGLLEVCSLTFEGVSTNNLVVLARAACKVHGPGAAACWRLEMPGDAPCIHDTYSYRGPRSGDFD